MVPARRDRTLARRPRLACRLAGLALAGLALSSPGHAQGPIGAAPGPRVLRPTAWPVDVPAGFGWSPPFQVFRRSTGGFFTTFDFEGQKVQGQRYYVDPVNGDDANGGTSWTDAVRGVDTAFTLANAGGVPVEILCKPGWYEAPLTHVLVAPQVDFSLICPDGTACLALTVAGTWSPVAGTSDVYAFTKTGAAPRAAVDRTLVDEYGDYVSYELATSLAQVDATPGSCLPSGQTIYVHTHDSRVPDDDIQVILSFSGHDLGTRRMYLEGIHYLGGNSYAAQVLDGPGEATFVRCRFSHAEGNCLRSLRNAPALIALRDCSASYSRLLDGFNYHRSGSGKAAYVLQQDCIGHRNGWDGGPNNNGTTIHDDGVIVDVNGITLYNQNRNVHHIQATRCWLLGCVAGYARDQSSYLDSAGFMFGRASGNDLTRAWLDSCVSLGGSVADFVAHPGSIVLLHATPLTGTAVGTFGSY